MAVAYAANVTKFNAGGSGDNIVADGYIKTVEKVWLDSYTMAAATNIPTNSFIDIAFIPNNKKITGIDLFFPASISGAATTGTGTTLSLGIRNAAGTTNGTLFLNAGECLTATTTLSANLYSGIGHVTSGGPCVVYITVGRLATTLTGTTTTPLIRSIVRYT